MLLTGALLGVLLASGGSTALREAVSGSAALHALVMVLALEVAVLPLAWLRVLVLECEYGLADVAPGAWWKLSVARIAISAVFAAGAAELLFAMLRTWPAWWWGPAAAAGVLLAALATSLAPAVILPLVDRPRPLGPGPLRARVSDLARRIGVHAIAVEECGTADPHGRARASLVGAGATRRVLVSSRLLADFTDDEIEVILAHELGHQVHRDLLRTLTAEFVVLLVGLCAAGRVLDATWAPLALASRADPAALPLILLVAGAVRVAAVPALNALSRRAEQRADRFALDNVSRPDAFAGAVRRMAAHTLAEEHPSRAVYWLFHTHPTLDQRIADAEAMRYAGDAQTRGAAAGTRGFSRASNARCRVLAARGFSPASRALSERPAAPSCPCSARRARGCSRTRRCLSGPPGTRT